MEAVANHIYDPNLPLFLVSDASEKALGAMLFQTDSQNQVLPLGFFSKPLTSAQRTYAAVDTELLGIEQAVLHFHFLTLIPSWYTLTTNHF